MTENNAVSVATPSLMDNAIGMSFFSMQVTTQAEKIALFNAINSPDDRLADHINESIEMAHMIIEMVDLVSEKTGEIEACPRIIIIDSKGKSYAAVSVGVFSALKKIVAIFGEPKTWDKPIKVKVKQVTKAERKMLTLEIVK